MKGIKLKSVLAGRKALVLGAAVAVVGLSLLSGATANAAVGTQPGTLVLNPGSGLLSLSPTWTTTVACPSTANGSANLQIVTTTGARQTISANDNSVAAPISTPQALSLNSTMSQVEGIGGYAAGQTAELVVVCFSGASGTGTPVRYLQASITFNTGNTTYTVSAHSGPGVTPTSTHSPASTSTAAAGTPNGAVGTGGGPAPGSDVPMAVGGIALLLVGGGLVLSRWRTAAGSLARRRRATGEPES